MRDRNHLNLQKFNIQLTKTILSSDLYSKILKQEEYFSHKTSLWRSDTKLPNSEFDLKLPKDFRLIRSLVISQWYFPEKIHFLYYLELENKTFSHFNEKQKIEISILLSSKENCEKYLFLTKRYTGNELFGNILGNNLKDLGKVLKLRFKFQTKARKKVFRRGPKDKGSRRSDSSVRIIEEETKKDVWVNEKEILLEKEKFLRLQTILRIKLILENYIEE